MVVGLADVEVADGCASWGAALGDLLRQPLGDFGGEVAAVELRNRGHDAVDEHPRRRLVDRLRRRHERDPGADEGFVNLHVIGAVPGEPVELVNNAELHPRRGDERQHVLQAATIRRPRRFPGVDELTHDPRTQLVSLPCVRLPLGGDGEAFLGAAALSLLPRGHPQIRDGQQNRRAGRRFGGRGVEYRGAHSGPPCRGASWC